MLSDEPTPPVGSILSVWVLVRCHARKWGHSLLLGAKKIMSANGMSGYIHWTGIT